MSLSPPSWPTTSAASLIGQEFCAAYAALKFALEGLMESLHFDLAPYNISTMSVEPGFFRTELLVEPGLRHLRAPGHGHRPGRPRTLTYDSVHLLTGMTDPAPTPPRPPTPAGR